MANEFKVKNGLIVDQGGANITGSSAISGSVGIVSSGSSVFTVDGTAGRLFSVDDGLSGSLFSVNTVAGLPIIEAFSDNTVRIGQYGQRVLFVSQSRVGLGKESNLNNILDISGSVTVTGSVIATSFTGSLQGTASFATTASFALNAGGGGSSFPYTGSAIISGSLRVTGSTSILGSGSRIFVVSGSTGGLLEVGDSGPSDVFSISSGSTEIFRIDSSKIVSISGSLEVTGSITGSLLGTASYVTASSVYGPYGSDSILSASYAVTAAFALNAGSGGSGGGGTSYPVTSTGISIADPTSAEDITLLYTSASVTIQAVEGVVRGSATPTVTVTLRYDADRNATGTAIVSAQSVSSTTTGNNLTLTANTTVPAFNFVWLETTATSGTVNELFVGLLYRSGSV